MAIFRQAFDRTLLHEGGYVNDIVDPGGETYKGVARKRHRGWEGWGIIDSLKTDPEFPDVLDDHDGLQSKVRIFYRENFWNRIGGDLIPDQELANELFDTGVNMGPGQAVKFLQKALNLLNRNGKSYADIKVDRGFGEKTLGALNAFLNFDDSVLLLKVINLQQGAHYLKIMEKKPDQERFARGWLKRVSIDKN